MAYFHACIAPTATKGPVSVWPFVSAPWSGTGAESGSTPNQDADRHSTSPSPTEAALPGRVRHILIAEDSKADLFLIREALRESGIDASIHVTSDGEETIKFFDNTDSDSAAPCPDLVLLDINMPRYKGADILRRLRSSARCANSLVLIVTSSDSRQDRQEMDALGANGYFRKPSDFAEFMKLGALVREFLASTDPPARA